MLILETGAGLSDANAYIDLDFADRFFDDRALNQRVVLDSLDEGQPVEAWIGTEPEREGAIIRATDHIDAVYATHFLSTPSTTTQALAFPRVDFNGLPIQLKKATALYAIRALRGNLIQDPGRTDAKVVSGSTGAMIMKREKIGPIEEETQYANPRGGGVTNYYYEHITPAAYPEADLMLQPLLKPESLSPPSQILPGRLGVFGTGTVIR